MTAAADEHRYLWQAVRRTLAADEVTALWLHYVDEMPLAEIAMVFGPFPGGGEDDDVQGTQEAAAAGRRAGA